MTSTLDKIAIIGNSHDGIIFIFVREDVPAKKVSTIPVKNFGRLSVYLNSVKLCCSYNQHKINISNHLHILGATLDEQINIV